MNTTLGTRIQFAELSDTEQELVEAAWDASTRAWDHFPVGAAILAVNSAGKKRVFQGGNVKNDVFSATMCAEQNAVFTAVQEGFKTITHVAVICRKAPGGSPCGICRQILLQYTHPDAIVLTIMGKDSVQRILAADLLPQPSGSLVEYDQLNAVDRELVLDIVQLMEQAYAPYSHDRRAAIVTGIMPNGEQGNFPGVQIDNASYPASISAERSAIAAAVTAGCKRIARIVVAAKRNKHKPTDDSVDGESLQFIREFGGVSTEIVLVSEDRSARFTTLGQLLPDSFGPDALGESNNL